MPGFFEVYPEERDEPARARSFVAHVFAGSTPGELVCYRRAANLQAEITQTTGPGELSYHDPALRVLQKDRRCGQWCEYEPGLDPRDHLMELKALRLEQDRKEFQLKLLELEQRLEDSSRRADRRLTKFAIILGVLIGFSQVAASILSPWLFQAVARFFH